MENGNNTKKKIFVAFGTRPEVIKLYPLIREIKNDGTFDVRVCAFRQHKDMLDQALRAFALTPDIVLPISLGDKGLAGATRNPFLFLKAGIQSAIGFFRLWRLWRRERPDLLVVQGDTSTALLAALIAFHMKVSVAHVEAGLRTNNKFAPFPEEINRRLISVVSDIHLAPTEGAKNNLLAEGISADAITVTGNTALDTLRLVSEGLPMVSGLGGAFFDPNKKIVVVTAHRRENHGDGIRAIAEAIRTIADARDDALIVYPVHSNPNVDGPMRDMLANQKNIILTPPMDYHSFVGLMRQASIILTDSGGIQEEVSLLGKPTLVMREVTERPEGIRGGNVRLVGTHPPTIVREVIKLLDNPAHYASMAKTHTAFGDGFASQKIIQSFKRYFA